MMKEIYARGPITCNFVGTDEFMFNSSENEGVLRENVYIDRKSYTKDDIDHVIELTGWGETTSGTRYWVVRNSWGTYWGDKGRISTRSSKVRFWVIIFVVSPSTPGQEVTISSVPCLLC